MRETATMNATTLGFLDPAPPEPITAPPLVHSTRQARAMLGDVGPSKLHQLLADGALDAVKQGNRTYITHDSLIRYTAALPKATFRRVGRRGK